MTDFSLATEQNERKLFEAVKSLVSEMPSLDGKIFLIQRIMKSFCRKPQDLSPPTTEGEADEEALL